MANLETIKSITDNLQTVLQSMGVKFARETIADESKIPASLIPFGQIFYNTEEFEYTHGQKPMYVDTEYLIRVVLREKTSTDLIRTQQEWVHLIRDGLTINALNINALASTKYVSRVTTELLVMDTRENTTFVHYTVKIRYREI